MKLKELIQQLQAIETESQNTDVEFQFAEWNGMGFSGPRTVHLVQISFKDGEGCAIVIGEHPEDAVRYKEFLDWMKEEDRKFGR